MIKKKIDGKNYDRAAIVAEYLSEENTYKSLSEKYRIPVTTISWWVRVHRQNKLSLTSTSKSSPSRERELEIELRKSQLKNELLEEMLKIASEQTGVDLRKKYGAKRS